MALLLIAPPSALAAPFAAYVIDARTGEVLYETNANTRLHPASLTKMMTLYVTFEAIERGEISLDTMVTVSGNAASQAPSRLGLRVGQRIAVRYLIRAAAVKSANDAATALCEAVGGSQAGFAKRMNRTAKAIGMTRSTFRNCNGLTAEGHLSTAHDMTMLGRHLFYDFPQYYGIFSRRTADAGIAQVSSTNRRFLDSYEGADGIKTGYTGPAGFNLTASAQRGSKRIIATILGGKSTADRNARMADLLDIGFGKAPNRTSVQPPLPPVYTAEADQPEDGAPAAQEALADALASGVADDLAASHPVDAPAAGKTLRLQVAVATSPRPRVRPQPDSSDPALEQTPVAEAGAVRSVMARTSDPGPVFAQTTAPQPETAALAAAIKAEGGPDSIGLPQEPIAAFAAVVPMPASPLVNGVTPATDTGTPADQASAMENSVGTAAAAPSVRPKPRPATLVASDENTDATAEAIASMVAEAVTGGPAVDPGPSAAETVTEVAAADPLPAVSPPLSAVAVGPDGTADAAASPDESAGPAMQTTVLPPTDQIVLASASATDVADTAAPEIVSRVSTSGGRQFGITLGRYPSRYDAETTLLQTALTEMSVLDEALRRVVQRKSGFDANFVGMTQQTAQLACLRLHSRNVDCTVFGPEG